MSNETTRREFIAKATIFTAGTITLSSLDSFASDSPPDSKLSKRVLGKTGVEMPILGLGADGMVTDTTDPDKDDAKMLGQKDGVLTALYKLRDQKVVRFIGLTGHSQDSQLKEALKLYEWDTFMCFVNPAKFSEPAIREQIPLAVKQNAGIIAMKTFGGRPGSLVGNSPGKADAEALLRYAWSQPITAAIPGVKSIKQFRENLSIAKNIKPMTPDEIQAMTVQINSGSKPWQR